jgi:hypothetical protein
MRKGAVEQIELSRSAREDLTQLRYFSLATSRVCPQRFPIDLAPPPHPRFLANRLNRQPRWCSLSSLPSRYGRLLTVERDRPTVSTCWRHDFYIERGL